MRRKWIILIALLLFLIGFYLFRHHDPKDLVFRGKRLSQWIVEAHADGHHDTKPAEEAIRAIGTNGVPYLVAEFIKPESRKQAAFNRWVENHPWTPFHFSAFEKRCGIAGEALVILRQDAKSALPTLNDCLTEYAGRGKWAAYVMSQVGETALPYLLKALASTNANAVRNGEVGLSNMRDASSALPTLIQLLQHSNGFTRSVVVRMLGATHSQSEQIQPALIAMLSDPDPRVQLNAVDALASKGVKPAVPALLRLTTNQNQSIAQAASNAVQRLDPSNSPQAQ